MGRSMYVILAVVCIVAVLAAANLHRNRTATNANNTGAAKAELNILGRELNILANELVPLKEKLADHKTDLAAAVKIIEKNRECEDETRVTMPDGVEVTLLAVRRDTNMRLQEMETLQKEIAQKEATISELRKRGGEMLSGISGRQPDEKIPPDIELLRRAGHLLDSQAIAAPTAAK